MAVNDSIHKILSNNTNLLLDDKFTSLTASGVKASANCAEATAIDREGTGSIELSGSLTDPDDVTFDIEIMTDTSLQSTISDPVFEGVGNGTISNIADTNMDAQDILVELIDLGTETTNAQVPFYGVILEALASGTSGNSIRISASLANITKTAINFSTFDALTAGQESVSGDEWNLGADYIQPLNQDGSVNSNAARLSFGTDPQSIKMYSELDPNTGDYIYYFTPPIKRAVEAGTVIYEVTGTYTITVTDGTTTETYSSVTTLYDFLAALLANSTLLTVIGVVSLDYAPGGMGTIDFPLRSAPFHLPIVTSGSEYVQSLSDDDLELALASDHPGEKVYLKCVNNDLTGQESWQVAGAVSGVRMLPDNSGELLATTGIRFTDPVLNLIGFKIPVQEPPEDVARYRHISTNYAAVDGRDKPPICVTDLTLCAAAVPKTITLVYTEDDTLKPDCECKGQNIKGGLKRDCCGTATQFSEGGEVLEQVVKQRFSELYEWEDDYISDNTALLGDTQGEMWLSGRLIENFTATMAYDRVDIGVCERIVGIFQAGLTQLQDHESNGAAAWAAAEAIVTGDIRIPLAVDNGHYYKALNDGTTNTPVGNEPTWPTDWSTVNDNGIIWEDMGERPLYVWDEALAAMKVDMAIIDDQDSGNFWKTLNVSDINAISANVKSWAATHNYNTGNAVWANGAEGIAIATCTVAGTSGGLQPIWSTLFEGDTLTDGTVTWRLDHFSSDEGLYKQENDEAIDYFLKQYVAQMNRCLVAADLEPIISFSLASTGGASAQCWQECDAGFHWKVNDGEYKDACTNVHYQSAKSYYDDELGAEVVYSTKEFTFAIRVNEDCTGSLKPGDTIVLIIDGPVKTYELDDLIEIPVVFNGPLYLSGGQTGNDTLTWRVTATVDGQLDDYLLDLSAPAKYHWNPGAPGFEELEFLITQGTIIFVLGDSFSFSIETGQFRWRMNGGAWSVNTNILTGGVSLAVGMDAEFTPGPAPSFEVGDTYSFLCHQRNSPSHVMTPTWEWWEWTDTTVYLTTDHGTIKIPKICALVHEIPQASVFVYIEGSNDNFATAALWSYQISWREYLMSYYFSTPPTAVRYTRFRILTAAGGKIKWVYTGSDPWEVSVPASQLSLSREYIVDRSNKANFNRSGNFQGKAPGANWQSGQFLTPDDRDELIDMLDHIKENDDEPIVFIPHHLHLDQARLVNVDLDNVEISDVYQYHPDADFGGMEDHRYGVTLPMKGAII